MVRKGNSGRDAGGQRGHQGGGEGQRDGKYFNNRSFVDFLIALKECVKNWTPLNVGKETAPRCLK